MEDLNQAIQGVLSNPQMMEQIMGLAQAFGGNSGESKEQKAPDTPPVDLSNLGAITGLLGQASIDSDQQTLLNALSPYLSGGRIGKLKKAMQAAKIAELATSMLGKNQAGETNV